MKLLDFQNTKSHISKLNLNGLEYLLDRVQICIEPSRANLKIMDDVLILSRNAEFFITILSFSIKKIWKIFIY
jgi:hypothetical protein